MYFSSDISFDEKDRYYEIENDKVKRIHYNLLREDITKISNEQAYRFFDYIPIKYMIRNIGSAAAIDVNICINGFNESLSIAKDESINLLLMVHLIDNKSAEFNIEIEYWDCESRGHYYTSEILGVLIKDDKENTIHTIKKTLPREYDIN
jgi:hypothetical protein